MAFATENRTTAQAGFAGGFGSFFAGIREQMERRKLFRETLRELNSLSNRELADLGLSRSMTRRIAYQAAYKA
ncbi:hypothetical protein AL036_13840 [Salipiger aestuarii]|uniref:Uncharacterized protein YjiS (DUF1127 family) n=1 Tax=Salipiger aestuarii TaxID=568098 RepID=A0A327Y1Q1_9RHOB|nr:DUF1127 domain-containing protein [Salipiger aestuarii]EIE50313.1 hypothetical protein C357_14611 [Citreicella sp. 357]KAA8606601.1 hypothetical protein AL036_13840 [Salipiger aestuarii]KAA8609206.1 hypothetical protein AL037_15455 [Salipiger aestuarii]KAB2541256.1 hypothetical protein AL035_13280 [Salipiger aestuarii]RAK15138.1 uncharacterized protein YjiS (DUF1127 family) [Salipiger aestuarii]